MPLSDIPVESLREVADALHKMADVAEGVA